MSFTKEITIWCDEPGCDYCEYGGWTVVNDMRNHLKSVGWTHSKGKDFCPVCSKKRRSPCSKRRWSL